LIPPEAIEQLKNQIPIFINDQGETYIKDKNDKIQKVEIDALGQLFTVNENGEREILDSKENPQKLNFQVHKDDKGHKFIVNKKGQQMVVKVDKKGQEYVITDEGKKVIINQQIKTDLQKSQEVKNHL
jgi:hypothetical protein